tara:strand:+ start:149 stop:2641 length:2493 start_codon:yes stop_codon:yes gene_type:complete
MAIGASQWMYRDDGYQINQSARLNATTSDYLHSTPSSAGNLRVWTFSFWVKLGTIGTTEVIFASNSDQTVMRFNGSQFSLREFGDAGNLNTWELKTAMLFRDRNAWYHIVCSVDTTQATDTNRAKIYVNGVEGAYATASYPDRNQDTSINADAKHNIGSRTDSNDALAQYFTGYLSEINHIDGTQYAANVFGEYNAHGGWRAIKPAVIYGTNGFSMKFNSSGNMGLTGSGGDTDTVANFTNVNIAATDQVLDTPSNNFATLDPNWRPYFTDNYAFAAITDGLLQADAAANVQKVHVIKSTFRMVGKVYFEVIPITQYYQIAGFGTFAWVGSSGIDDGGTGTRIAQEGVNWYVNNGTEVFSYRQGGSQVDSGDNAATISANTRMQFAYDEASGKGWIGVNNDWYAADGGTDGDPATGANPTVTITAANRGDIFPGGADFDNGTASGSVWNFGQDSSFSGRLTAQGETDENGLGDFYYEPPAGFLAMCTKNLPEIIIKPQEHFNTLAYTGAGANQVVRGVGFDPDWLWLKNRDLGYGHLLFDAMRGLGDASPGSLSSDAVDVEGTFNYINAVSDGFTTVSQQYTTNNPGSNMVAWNWNAPTAFSNDTSATSVGNVDSSGRVNTDAGFSIVSWQYTTAADNLIAHGLSVAPTMMIIKSRTTNYNWDVYHKDLTNYTKRLLLNTTSAQIAGFADTAPTSTVFEYNTSAATDEDNMIAYLFHSVEGYSKVGSYKGNGSADGPFIYTGFRPAWVMTKVINAADNWSIADNKRSPDNVAGESLRPDTVNAEDSAADIDILSNGFKVRQADSHRINYAADSFIFLAFAETPFKYGSAR